MITANLYLKGLITPPKFVPSNTMYETIMGSVAYGVSSDTSDCDIYGFCIPPKNILFPSSNGLIPGFDQIPKFDQYQQHGVKHGDKVYDLSIYNLVKYFKLCAENNPNMIDSLYTPIECVLHCTRVGNMVRDNRDLFLSKQCLIKFRGYAYSQLHKLRNKENRQGKRTEIIEKYGYDVKFAYHVVRLMDECEQILTNGTINLQRDKERLKAIRKGEVKEAEIFKLFDSQQERLQKLADKSKLPEHAQHDKLKKLLLNCIEEHYGKLEFEQSDPRLLDELLSVQSSLGKIISRFSG